MKLKLKMKYGFSIAALLASGLLSGCANAVYEGRFSWEEGWRRGVVTAVGEGTVFADKLAKNCRNALSSLPQSNRYATIMYRPASGRIWLTVPISMDASLKPDDSVYVNMLDCSKRVERRSS